jgi:hypothetical protein
MATRRSRLRPLRLLLLVGLLLLLLLLLELHRFLPGGWPGGGGPTGFRRLDVAEGSDPTRVVRPEGWKPDWQPKDGTTLRVRLPDGVDATGWRVSAGEAGAFDGPERGGDRLLVRDAALTRRGFAVRWPGGVVTHAAPPAGDPVPTWRVALPQAVPPPRLSPRSVVLTVVDSTRREPVVGARVQVEGEATPRVTDEKGRVTLKGLTALTGVRIEAGQHAPERTYVHPQAGAEAVVALAPLRRLWVPFLDAATRTEVPILAARLKARDGRVLWEAVRTAAARPSRVDAEVRGDDLRGARLTVAAEGRPLTEVAFEPGTREVVLADPGRELKVTARDGAGRPVALRSAQAAYGSSGANGLQVESAGVLERLEPERDGTLRVTVPKEGSATLVLESAQHAPAVLQVDPTDEAGPREVVLEPGVRVPVLVLDRRGRPLRDATVVGRVVLDGVRVEVQARTDPEGRARVGPLPPGPCEILAHAPDRAWAAQAAEAHAPMQDVELRLAPGAPLRLRVATPFGVPLADVRVSAMPTDDAPADVEPPNARPWTTDADGQLVVPDMPVRPYRLRLERAGHADETIDDVTPGPIWYFATLVPGGDGTPDGR